MTAITLDVITTLDLDPDLVLEKSVGEVSEVVICGLTKDGDEFFASSVADGRKILWHLERMRHRVMQEKDAMVEKDDG